MRFYLYNTLTRRKAIFTPADGRTVRMYNCGPTVYSAPHLGNLRAYIFADLLRRGLELVGWRVIQVMNITDVGHLTSQADTGEDKMARAARESGQTAWAVAKHYTKLFLTDAAALHIKRPAHLPRATAHIPEQIKLIKKLEEKGFTYKISDGVYFDTAKFKNYGALGGQNQAEKLAGARVEVQAEKRQPEDFALWKFSQPGEKRDMEWVSPWGKGFPGWHIECSAMARKYLGQPFDIHTGGIDHIPIHHANEIAQSEAAYGVPLARFWLHNEFLTLTEKMSKSLGNVLTLTDLRRRGFHPLAFRLLVISAHYRSPLQFSFESLAEAQHHLIAYHTAFKRLTSTAPTKTLGSAAAIIKLHGQFLTALADDLDTPKALAAFYQFLRRANAALDQKKFSAPEKKAAQKFLTDAETVFALKDSALLKPKVPAAIKKRLKERETFRQAKNFAAADRIRTAIIAHGYLVEDTPQGPRVYPLPKPT